MLLDILLQIKGADFGSLYSLFRENGAMLAGVGFVFAGLAVLKKGISNPDRVKDAMITYFVALVIWLVIWNLT